MHHNDDSKSSKTRRTLRRQIITCDEGRAASARWSVSGVPIIIKMTPKVTLVFRVPNEIYQKISYKFVYDFLCYPAHQWCSPRDQDLGLEAPRGQKWKSWSWSWSWIMKSWSLSRSWRKGLAVFQDFCCNSWRQWARHTMAFCERQQKQFAIRKPLFEKTCAQCTSASVERVFNSGAIC